MLKSQVALNELEPNLTDIICSLFIDKYINCPNQYESLSLVEFNFFCSIKKIRFQNIANPKLLGLKINQENKFCCIHHFKIQKTRNLKLM